MHATLHTDTPRQIAVQEGKERGKENAKKMCPQKGSSMLKRTILERGLFIFLMNMYTKKSLLKLLLTSWNCSELINNELGSRCFELGGLGKWSSGKKEVSMVTCEQPPPMALPHLYNQLLPTQYLSESGGKEGKIYQAKWLCYRPAIKWTQRNHEELPAELWVAPKLHCFDFNLT